MCAHALSKQSIAGLPPVQTAARSRAAPERPRSLRWKTHGLPRCLLLGRQWQVLRRPGLSSQKPETELKISGEYTRLLRAMYILIINGNSNIFRFPPTKRMLQPIFLTLTPPHGASLPILPNALISRMLSGRMASFCLSSPDRCSLCITVAPGFLRAHA